MKDQPEETSSFRGVGVGNVKRGLQRIGDIEIDLRVEASLAPSVLRAFAGVTAFDLEVDSLPLPKSPFWLHYCVRLLRWYRTSLSPYLGQRCVLDPSCSRFSELAFRRHGFFKGALATIERLWRCRPGAGGIDVP